MSASADAVALAALTRDCATSGVERIALHLRFSALPAPLRGPHHRRLLSEVLAPVMRPTRARVFTLPGGDMVVVAPPPGRHLETARAALERMLPEAAEAVAGLLRLPAEGARLLATVEAALGLARSAPPEDTQALPPPDAALAEAALRRLASTDLAACLRRRTVWQLDERQEAPRALWVETRVHLRDLVERLLPGHALDSLPPLGRLFRRAAEDRLLTELGRPETLRAQAALCLPLALGSLAAPPALRLLAALGPEGRRQTLVCVPLAEALADPAGLGQARRLARHMGFALGLDEVEPEALARMPLTSLVEGPLRLRHRPPAEPALRRRLDRALPEDRTRLILLGADEPGAIAWGWQRGITRFSGRMLDAL